MHRARFTQEIEVAHFQGKRFRISASVKAIPVNDQASANFYVKIHDNNSRNGFLHDYREDPIQNEQWETHTLEGRIDSFGTAMVLGGQVDQSGKFSFDDFKLEVEISDGQWTDVALKNPGFENWFDSVPTAWQGNLFRSANFISGPDSIQHLSGKYCLNVVTDGYDVLNEHETKAMEAHYPFEYITVDDGLPGGWIGALHQDRTGLIWIGSEEGLVRFDGHTYKRYEHKPGDSMSLSANDVSVIFEDSKSRLWIGTRSGGLNLFDQNSEQFHRYMHSPDDSTTISHNIVTVIYETEDETLWVGGYLANGLNHFNPETGKFTRYLYGKGEPFGLQSIWIHAIHEGQDGRLWLGTYGAGLAYLDRTSGRFHHYYTLESHPHGYGTSYILSIFEEDDGSLLLGSENTYLYRFDTKGMVFTDAYFLPDTENLLKTGAVIRFILDSDKGFWLIHWGGVTRFFPEDAVFQYILDDGRMITSMIFDREGMLWLGSNKGISRLNPYRQQFQNQQFKHLDLAAFTNIDINGPIQEDSQGHLWIKSSEKIFRADLSSGQTRNVLDDFEEPVILNTQFAFLEDSENIVWLGIGSFGLAKWDPDNPQLQEIGTKGIKGLREPMCLLEVSEKTLLIGTWQGIWEYDRARNSFKKIPYRYAKGGGYDLIGVNAIHKDRNGTVWIGTGRGHLAIFDPKTKLMLDMTPPDVDVSVRFGKDMINSISEDDNGRLWFGTAGNGLRCIDRVQDTILHYTKNNGLPNNFVSGIIEDDQNQLWISTRGGLARLDPNQNSIRVFTREDGLPTNFLGSMHKGKYSGNIYLGTAKGLVVFHPDSIFENSHIPQLVFTEISFYDDRNKGDLEYLKGVTNLNKVKFPHTTNLIDIEFSALSFSKASKNQYAYKMAGLNDQWIQLGSKHSVSFHRLPPGNYTLQVKGSNGDHIWNNEGVSLEITITPPWFWNTWTQILYLLILGGGLYWLYTFRLQRRIALVEAKNLRELDEAKTRLYTNISHEFRTPITVILGMVEQIRANRKKWLVRGLNMIDRNAHNVLKLVNQMLNLQKLEAGTLQTRTVQGDIVAYLTYLVESYISLAETQDIQLNFHAAEESIVMDYDPEKIRVIISNLLTNAIKFTPVGGVITMAVGKEVLGRPSSVSGQYTLRISVTDTGIGIAHEKLPFIFDRFYQVDDDLNRVAEGSGIGLSLTKQLIELFGGSIDVKSTVGVGTVFSVELPIKNEAEFAEGRSSVTFAASQGQHPQTLQQGAETIEHISQDRPLVLIAEDNPDVTEYIQACLGEGYNTTTAINGEEGISKAIEIVPDIIISDVMMPVRDGFELCQALKTDKRTSHIPIILLTAKADMDSKLQGLEIGADAYLTKPFNKAELLLRIRKLLELRGNLQAFYSTAYAGQDAKPQEGSKPQEHEFVLELQNFIQKNLNDNRLSVEDLATAMHMSRSQLHRKLKALTGLSTIQFMRDTRLQEAKNLLKSTDSPVSNIAYDTGFSDPGYFSKVFKKECLMTPSEYRDR